MELGTFKRDFKKFIGRFPDNIQAILKTKTYLAGGALRSLVLNQIPKDYDIFFLDRESRSKVINALEQMARSMERSMVQPDLVPIHPGNIADVQQTENS